MNRWQEVIREVIDSIPFAPYARGNGDGVTENIYWNNKLIYKPGFPVTSMCVGAVAEVFFKALKVIKIESEIPVKVIKSLRPWIYVYEEKYRTGVAGGLVSLGWADWVEDPLDAEYGDLCQIHGTTFDNRAVGSTPYWDDGHCVVVTGVGEKNGKPILLNWSSSSIGEFPGHLFDWHWIEREVRGIKRSFSIARMKPSFLGID